jgi:hypothetical protein
VAAEIAGFVDLDDVAVLGSLDRARLGAVHGERAVAAPPMVVLEVVCASSPMPGPPARKCNLAGLVVGCLSSDGQIRILLRGRLDLPPRERQRLTLAHPAAEEAVDAGEQLGRLVRGGSASSSTLPWTWLIKYRVLWYLFANSSDRVEQVTEERWPLHSFR